MELELLHLCLFFCLLHISPGVARLRLAVAGVVVPLLPRLPADAALTVAMAQSRGASALILRQTLAPLSRSRLSILMDLEPAYGPP